MVYMHFPHSLTEEEESLQKKYALLKKKKKILAALRAAAKPEPPQPIKIAKKQPSEAAANATEQAKRLLKSGAIKVEIERKDQQHFKRSKRQKDPAEKSAVGFQPFNTNHGSDVDEDKTPTPRVQQKGLYDHFVSSSERHSNTENNDRNPGEKRFMGRQGPPKKGNTVYVYGPGVNPDLLRKAFSNIGAIISVAMEKHKPSGFVTFEKMESADQAIAELNGTMVDGAHLQVSMAHKQRSYDAPSMDPSISSWPASSQSQKGGNHQDSRALVDYSDSMF